MKFTKSSERPKVRLENRKSADLENRLNLKSADEEVKVNIEEEGSFYFYLLQLVLAKFVAYDRASVPRFDRDGAWNLKGSEH